MSTNITNLLFMRYTSPLFMKSMSMRFTSQSSIRRNKNSWENRRKISSTKNKKRLSKRRLVELRFTNTLRSLSLLPLRWRNPSSPKNKKKRLCSQRSRTQLLSRKKLTWTRRNWILRERSSLRRRLRSKKRHTKDLATKSNICSKANEQLVSW